MLIAKPDRPADSPRALIEQLDARLRQSAAAHKGESLFPGYGVSMVRMLLSLASLIGSLLCWLAFFFARRFTDSDAVRFSFVGAALLLGLYNRIDDRRVKRRLERYNAGARVGLGGLVQANLALFDPDNEQPAYGLAVVTLDPDLQADPERLLELAGSLFAYAKEGVEPVPEALQDVVERVRDERVRYQQRVRLPRAWTGNDDTWLFDLLFLPEHLPRGCVDRRLWPVMFHADDLEVPPQVPDKALWWVPAGDLLEAYALDPDDAGD